MRKYKINEKFFSTIDTQEKAYVLGLLYADGYVNKLHTCITLALSEKDADILKKICGVLVLLGGLYLIYAAS